VLNSFRWLIVLAAIATAPGVAGVRDAAAQEVAKVRYAEVIRSIFYLPKYMAFAKGYFKEEGLDVDMTTAQGSDKAVPMLLAGQTDIALLGPESAVYVEGTESLVKTKWFSALTATDGLFLVSREKLTMEQFDWKMLTGKKVMGWRTGTTPGVFFEAAMKARRLDIKGGMDLVTSVSVPARMGAWQAGQFDFAVFFEPEVSRLETAGQAFPVASIGKEIGPVDYTVFIATDAYLKKNPAVVQRFTDAVYKAQKWTATADAREAARLASPYFPGMAVELIASSIERYRKFGIWKTDPETKPEALARLQDLLIEGGVLKPDKRVKFESVVDPTFARKAKETVK
jgi:NitT/TauT family transport system substrate-binding protein